MAGQPIYLSMSGKSLNVTNGQANNPSNASTHMSVLCGDKPPTLTGGFAKWSTIDRPLTRGLTVFQGYDPRQFTVELRFGSWTTDGSFIWRTDNASAIAVEDQISTLESWAGTKIDAGGPPSVVYISSVDNGGNQAELMPKRYWNLPWVITNIQYGESYRNQNGYRIRQDATVTFMNYVNLGSTPSASETVNGGFFKTSSAKNTALEIAAAPSGSSPPPLQQALAQSILKAPQNNPVKGTKINLSSKTIHTPLPSNIAIWVPSHLGG